MKRLRRIIATEKNDNADIQFTLEDVCELLSHMTELTLMTNFKELHNFQHFA